LTPKRREECVLLLDDCFDSESFHAAICALGFKAVRFTQYFPSRDRPEKREDKVKDSRVIKLCQKHRFLLLTTDHEMKKTFIEELKGSDIAVLATANNHDGPGVWLKAIRDSRAKIARDFKKQKRPYFSVIQKSGAITTNTLTMEMANRRTRPKEHEQISTPIQPF
jgi:hypothetical protein